MNDNSNDRQKNEDSKKCWSVPAGRKCKSNSNHIIQKSNICLKWLEMSPNTLLLAETIERKSLAEKIRNTFLATY